MGDTNQKLEIVRLFHEVNKISMRCMRKNFENIGITMPQGIVIHTLKKYGEMKLSELSKKVNLTNSTVTGIIDRLEKQELVVRKRSEQDRRIIYVDVTPKLKEMHKEIYKKTEKSFEDLLASGTPEELEKIVEGLIALKKILNTRELY